MLAYLCGVVNNRGISTRLANLIPQVELSVMTALRVIKLGFNEMLEDTSLGESVMMPESTFMF